MSKSKSKPLELGGSHIKLSEMSDVDSIPEEIWWEIGQYLDSVNDIRSLIFTSSYLGKVFTSKVFVKLLYGRMLNQFKKVCPTRFKKKKSRDWKLSFRLSFTYLKKSTIGGVYVFLDVNRNIIRKGDQVIFFVRFYQPGSRFPRSVVNPMTLFQILDFEKNGVKKVVGSQGLNVMKVYRRTAQRNLLSADNIRKHRFPCKVTYFPQNASTEGGLGYDFHGAYGHYKLIIENWENSNIHYLQVRVKDDYGVEIRSNVLKMIFTELRKRKKKV